MGSRTFGLSPRRRGEGPGQPSSRSPRPSRPDGCGGLAVALHELAYGLEGVEQLGPYWRTSPAEQSAQQEDVPA
jgi:hypothetical protein